MTIFSTIPKLLPARESIKYDQKIPKIIWQTMKTNLVPPFMKKYADTWIDLNPEYEYRLHDDDDIIDFIKVDFPNYLEGYKKLKHGASKADLWRYLIIYKYGGVYADMDCRCITPLREWINPEASLVTQLGTNKDLCQWLIITVPKNPIFLKAAQKTLQNSENNNCYTKYYGFTFLNNKLVIQPNGPSFKFNHEVLGLSGPPVLQQAAEVCFKEESLSDILPFIQVVCVSSMVSCQMKGYVSHDTGHAAYKKALRKLKTNYYGRFLSRLSWRIRKYLTIFKG